MSPQGRHPPDAERKRLEAHRGLATWGDRLVPLEEFRAAAAASGRVLEEAARGFGGKVKVVKVDIDQNKQLAEEFGIKSIPALMIFKGGEVVAKKVGLTSRADLEAMAERALG